MRHRKRTAKLGRTIDHRRALMGALVCGLIQEKRIRTTLPKARAARSLAERLVTLARRGTLAARRRIASKIRREDCVKRLFEEVLPAMQGRHGGYTRIVKIGRRYSDNSEMVLLEWVGVAVPDKRKKKKSEGEKDKEKPSQ